MGVPLSRPLKVRVRVRVARAVEPPREGLGRPELEVGRGQQHVAWLGVRLRGRGRVRVRVRVRVRDRHGVRVGVS